MKQPIRWEDPKPSQGWRAYTDSLREQLAALVDHPGRWAVIEEEENKNNTARVFQTKAARIKELSKERKLDGIFEATVRAAKGDKTASLYVRYVGPYEQDGDGPDDGGNVTPLRKAG
jgi:hypothetical protein